ncbi:MAG TPA: glycosyltransferase family 2 protein [Labilithrix sp.]|nr:glycosyltransferase family 2 protein [Labilithrix sp.]
MAHLFWYLKTNSPFEHLSAAAYPIFAVFLLYQLDYLFLFARHCLAVVLGRTGAPKHGARPSALVVMPTLIRSRDELDGLQKAIISAAQNGYPGELHIVASIDDGMSKPALYAELQAWIAAYAAPEGVRIHATFTPARTGKAVAIDYGVRHIKAEIARGTIAAFPVAFFNMDADSELSPHALTHMVDRLTTPSWINGKMPMIITSNVGISKRDYWTGWRGFFSVRGQLAVQVAREYLQSISMAKFNTKLLPVIGASGALYCTWGELHLLAPRWAAFMQTLKLRSWLGWWVGEAPPSFADADLEELPEAQTGPGDDTWMTWLASCARWENGRITVELPRTPAHAFYYLIHNYFFRPVAHEPEARISTKTPTTVKALFKQRIRWNSSRIQDSQRWRPALAYHWSVGLPVVLSTGQLIYVNAMVAASLVIFPFTMLKGNVLVSFVLAYTLGVVIRSYGTVVALIIDGNLRQDAGKLLALPLSVPYHFVFNVLTTITGAAHDILFFGVNTKFSPEETCIKSRLTRIAVAYRLRRAFALAIRSVIHNDVPLGWFWFGWHESEFTPNGFEGWSSGKRTVLKARVAAVPATVAAPVAPAAPALAATPVVAAAPAPVAAPILSIVPPSTAAPASVAGPRSRPRPTLVPSVAESDRRAA